MTSPIDDKKRRFLANSTAVVGAAGLAAASVPFIASLSPSEKVVAAGAPVDVDVGQLAPGQMITVAWRGKPVFIVHRTDEALSSLTQLRGQLSDPDSTNTAQQPAYCQNTHRAIKQHIIVLIGICTHLGCAPNYRPELAPTDLGEDWLGGFFCPCHGSKFDIAGRVYQGAPAPSNLAIPPYRYVSDTILRIGEDAQGAA